MRIGKTFGAVVLAVAAGAGAFFLLDSAPRTDGGDERPSAREAPSVHRAERRSAPGAKVRTGRQKPSLGLSEEDDDDDGRTPAERALAARIEKALDEEDFSAAVACAEEAQQCGVAEIRQAMVDTLVWFGEKALPELMPFLADADEDVRESAKDGWSMAVSSIEDDGVKIGVVELAMGVLTDEETLEDISGEYIGVDEKLAVESLARIIGGGGSKEGVAKAKETYEFVTGEEWTGKEAAERWIAEEYEPPQDPPGDGSPLLPPLRQ